MKREHVDWIYVLVVIVVAIVAIVSMIASCISDTQSAIAPAGKFTRLTLPSTNIQDSMESYAQGVFVNGLNGGTGWQTPWMDMQNILGIQAGDNLDTPFYSNGAAVNGLNKGFGFEGAFMDMDSEVSGFFGADNMESYASGTDLNGLNGNTALPNGRVQQWATAWMSDP